MVSALTASYRSPSVSLSQGSRPAIMLLIPLPFPFCRRQALESKALRLPLITINAPITDQPQRQAGQDAPVSPPESRMSGDRLECCRGC